MKENKSNQKLFEMEPNDSNVLQWYLWGIDTFNYWISEDKKSSLNFMCLSCALSNIDQLRNTQNLVKFHYKYEDSELEIFFKRLEWKIWDENYKDTGLQIKLLLKTNWPSVRTKQDLLEENIPCILYDSKKTDWTM